MITHDEFLMALEEAQNACPIDADGMTATEIADEMGRHVMWIRELLRRAMKQGRLELSGYKTIDRIDGRKQRVPCYRILPPKDG